MSIISKDIYEQIQKDIPRIEDYLEYPMLRSQSFLISQTNDLWEELKIKYSVIFPEMMKNIKEKSHLSISVVNEGYSSELMLLKTGLLAYLLVNDVDEESDKLINNDSTDLMHKKEKVQEDIRINEIIEESKIYMRSDDSSKKQIGLERIWDAFERLKTVYEKDGKKKKGIETIINKISHDSEVIKDMFNNEFRALTDIGNAYQIRHFEKGKIEIPSDGFREYLYFRMLSLISFCIQESKDINL